MDNEQNQLNDLVAGYALPDDLRGELTFGALYDEARLDLASPFFQGEGYEFIKTIGLRDPLLSLLDDFMAKRSQKGQVPYRDGLLRVGDGKAVVEWLPEGAAQAAADVRRDDANLVPWLMQALDKVQSEAIRVKRAKDPDHWKRKIWRSPDKNRDIKAALLEEGERLGFQVLPSKSRGEWLYDLIWRRLDGNRNVIGITLAVEIEVSDSRAGGIRYDFNKLLQAQADHKLMVFQVKTSEDIKQVCDRLVRSIRAFPHAHPCRYLLCGWSTQENAFHYREHSVSTALVDG